eukprot:TRINITY_DN244_c0_g1_i1.p1 TRINITY_DN244_c0_g1~~TRINITY_DN244_c0_g1_i1.p1  ORF type:complete len:528 (+),score=157.59 TRINITY_DN244_c0_g1_i1:98-1585(+)
MTLCKHDFHLQCILEWSQRSHECPMCWRPLSLKDPDSQELLLACTLEQAFVVQAPPRNNNPHPQPGFLRSPFEEGEVAHQQQHRFASSRFSEESDFERRIMQHFAAAVAGISQARNVDGMGSAATNYSTTTGTGQLQQQQQQQRQQRVQQQQQQQLPSSHDAVLSSITTQSLSPASQQRNSVPLPNAQQQQQQQLLSDEASERNSNAPPTPPPFPPPRLRQSLSASVSPESLQREVPMYSVSDMRQHQQPLSDKAIAGGKAAVTAEAEVGVGAVADAVPTAVSAAAIHEGSLTSSEGGRNTTSMALGGAGSESASSHLAGPAYNASEAHLSSEKSVPAGGNWSRLSPMKGGVVEAGSSSRHSDSSSSSSSFDVSDGHADLAATLSRWAQASNRYRETLTKGTQNLREKIGLRSGAVLDFTVKAREVGVGVVKALEKIAAEVGTSIQDRPSQPPNVGEMSGGPPSDRVSVTLLSATPPPSSPTTGGASTGPSASEV